MSRTEFELYSPVALQWCRRDVLDHDHTNTPAKIQTVLHVYFAGETLRVVIRLVVPQTSLARYKLTKKRPVSMTLLV